MIRRAINKFRKTRDSWRLHDRIKVNATETRKYGNEYGGFAVPCVTIEAVKNRGEGTLMTFGIGKDLSFSEAIMEENAFNIYAFDFTPESIQWVSGQTVSKSDRFCFYDFGIAKQSGVEKLFLPKTKGYVSGSLDKWNGVRDDYVEVGVKTFGDILDMLSIEHIDILKLDVEGTEFAVMDDILKYNSIIDVITFEQHSRFYGLGYRKMLELDNALREKGFECVEMDRNAEVFTYKKA